MSITAYLREIGRGQKGARALSREQATDLMGQLLDQTVSDRALGAFCMAMRFKGETVDEMLGFLDALQGRMPALSAQASTVVIPSYNGARRRPVLTPLLAGLLAQRGHGVLMHGMNTEAARVTAESVVQALGWPVLTQARAPGPGEVVWMPTELLSPGLAALLSVRFELGLRNTGHSLVKLLQPMQSPALLITSYTHPEYLVSMSGVLAQCAQPAMLVRASEGEAVADARRRPQMDAWVSGQHHRLMEAEQGMTSAWHEAPTDLAPEATAEFTRAVLAGQTPAPSAIADQVAAASQAMALAGFGASR